MSQSLRNVDERTSLAGTNRLEALLFTLGRPIGEKGREEWFGINVFKVREVMHRPEITRAPDMPPGVEGMVSLRGVTLPVINLPRYCKVDTEDEPNILIITEYNQNVQGFLVHEVDSIVRMSWKDVKEPPAMITAHHGGLVTSVAEAGDRGLIMIMDVEKVLAESAGIYDDKHLYDSLEQLKVPETTVLFADDSAVARTQIRNTLEHLGLRYIETRNGKEAWEKLQALADESGAAPLQDRVQIILTDIEMPEMDGFVLTRRVKEDERFKNIPVLMHSSLSGEANASLGKAVGVDAFVSKFDPEEMTKALVSFVGQNAKDGSN